VHPEYREVLRTYAKNSGLHVEEIGYTKSGTVDAASIKSALRDDVAAVGGAITELFWRSGDIAGNC